MHISCCALSTQEYHASEEHTDALRVETDQLQAHCTAVHTRLYELRTLLQQVTATNNTLSHQV
jgi:phage shock protein A